ncbi:MAG: hypothetical protein ACTSU4_10445 [Promethearchaeota archaeon]
MKKSFILSARRIFFKGFIRDMAITPQGFIYFLLAFLFSMFIIDYVYLSFLSFNPEKLLSILGVNSLLTILLSIIFSGFIVDKIKDRVKLLVICSFFTLLGFILINFGTIFETIGYSLMLFFVGLYLIDLLTILTHESTILNRGRLLGYVSSLSLLSAHLIIVFTDRNYIIIFFLNSFIFLSLLLISLQYEYKETEERLRSDKRFWHVIFTPPIFGYIMSFLVLGFVLGNAYPLDVKILINPTLFILILTFFFLLSGISLDNLGRKTSFTIGILILSSLIIFSGIFKELYSEIFLGISIPIIFIILFTLTGDFSTERMTLKYRGRITSMFLLFVIIGFIGGILLRYFLTLYYVLNPQFYWIPELINGINSLLLIGLLVWIMPLSEILTSKEADWAVTLKNLYVIYKNSTCLYAKDFIQPSPSICTQTLNEDLISSGFKGIIDLISEITKEKRHLRIIDKEGSKIYFSYGKHVIIALISTKILPVLFKKLELFTKAFEKQFSKELEYFNGNIQPFLATEQLILKYFK